MGMEISYVNTTEGRLKYQSAVDMVCNQCHYCKEDTCESCPVKKTVDEIEAVPAVAKEGE